MELAVALDERQQLKPGKLIHFIEDQERCRSRSANPFERLLISRPDVLRGIGEKQEQVAVGERCAHLLHHLLVETRARVLDTGRVEKNNLSQRLRTLFLKKFRMLLQQL